MREPILPPPPPIWIAVWAALNALFYRAVAACLGHAAAARARVGAAGASVVEAVQVAPRRALELLADAGSHPSLPSLPLAALSREERATVVERARRGA
jgi:hypothetical protein